MTATCILPRSLRPHNIPTLQMSRFQLVEIRGTHIRLSVPISNSEFARVLDVQTEPPPPLHLSYDLSLPPPALSSSNRPTAFRISRQVHVVSSPLSLYHLCCVLFHFVPSLPSTSTVSTRGILSRSHSPFLVTSLPPIPFTSDSLPSGYPLLTALVFSPQPLISNVFPSLKSIKFSVREGVKGGFKTLFIYYTSRAVFLPSFVRLLQFPRSSCILIPSIPGPCFP